MEGEIARLRRLADAAVTQYRTAQEALRTEKKAKTEYEQELVIAQEAQQHLQAVAAALQTNAHEQITSVVTRCLQTVFGPEYEFKIQFERKRGKTEARLCYVKYGIEIDPASSDSGGVMDLAALALRISALLLATPKRRQIIIADEPLRNVHGDEYRQRATKIVETLANDLGVQIILVTGLDWLRIGKIQEIRP